MNNRTRSHLNLQNEYISDLLYCTSSQSRSNPNSISEKSSLQSLSEPNLLKEMPTSQLSSELVDEKTHTDTDSMFSLNNKSTLQLLREQEQIALQSINKLTDDEMTNIDQWLSNLHKMYENLQYPLSHRVFQATTYFNEEQQLWFQQVNAEINNDWSCFCECLKQYVYDRQKEQPKFLPMNNSPSIMHGITSLENLVDTKFTKYSGVGDAKVWLLQTMNQFKQYGLHRMEQFHSIPFLLIDEAYLWYVKHTDLITNFESFSKLFLAQFSSIPSLEQTNNSTVTNTLSTSVSSFSSVSHLQRTVADEIIKKPTFFRGSKDDVHDWLEQLEQRFNMAKWNDEQKLQYISIHLQEDAYRWWIQTSTSVKTWSLFIEAITKAFGSTKVQELAFEQLKWYKQTVNQSITQYYDKIIELCKKVDPTMPDSLKLKYLMAGIKESLKIYVALQDPRTTETFLSIARKVEDTLALTSVTADVQPNNVNINAVTFHKSSTQSTDTQKSVSKEHNDTNQPSQPQLRYRNYQNNSSNRNKKVTTYAPVRYSRYGQRSNNCYRCGTPGHYARDCTQTHFD